MEATHQAEQLKWNEMLLPVLNLSPLFIHHLFHNFIILVNADYFEHNSIHLDSFLELLSGVVPSWLAFLPLNLQILCFDVFFKKLGDIFL